MKLSIDLSAGARSIAGLELNRDGSPVPREEWGVPVPVDPGNYRVSARAPGRREWTSVVLVREPGKVVAVSVPELQIKESAPPSDARAERPIMPAIVLAGVALAGLGTGIGLTIAANRKSDDAASLSSAMDARAAPGCNSYPPSDSMTAAQCAELLGLLKDHDVNHDRAVAAYITGGAFLGLAAASLYLWPAPSPKRASVAQVGPIVTWTEYGIRIQGSF
jgi:hypothetical protein